MLPRLLCENRADIISVHQQMLAKADVQPIPVSPASTPPTGRRSVGAPGAASFPDAVPKCAAGSQLRTPVSPGRQQTLLASPPADGPTPHPDAVPRSHGQLVSLRGN